MNIQVQECSGVTGEDTYSIFEAVKQIILSKDVKVQRLFAEENARL